MLDWIRSWFRVLIRRGEFEHGMSEELRFHIDEYVAELVRSGVSPSEASRRARLEFGSIDGVKQECRQARGLQLFDELTRNLRQSARLLLKTPGYALAAIVPLAFCLAANIAIFAVVDGIVLRPLPFPDPGRLVLLYNSYPKAGIERGSASPANYYERRGRLASVANLAVVQADIAIVGETGSTELEDTLQVSTDFFDTLGVRPVMGRTFRDEESTYQTDRVVILSHTYWTQRFHADPQAIGRQIRMDGISRTIVGVLPPGFRYLSSRAGIYTPYASEPSERAVARRHSGRGGEIIARLKPGVSIEVAQAEVDALDSSTAHEYPQARMIASAGFRTKMVPLHADHVASVRPTLLLLQAGVFVLLVIGGVNLVNLLLIRASARAKELTVRLALGASRLHVIGEVITETAVLTTLAGLLGLAIGAAGIRLLPTIGVDRLPMGAHIEFDVRLALLALLASLLTGILVGLPVALFSLRSRLNPTLQSEARGGTTGRAAQGLRHGFIVAQVAMAFVLLSAAGLLGLSLEKVGRVSLGLPADHLLSGRISLPWKIYAQPSERLAFVEKLQAELAGKAGVGVVGFATNLPLSGRKSESGVSIVNRPASTGEPGNVPNHYSVGGDYFAAMRIPLREGRWLNADDSRRPERVCVVDEIFAKRFWPSGGALGQQVYQGLRLHSPSDAFTIVGVVGSVKQTDLSQSKSQGGIYFPFGHRAESSFYVVLRTAQAPETVSTVLRQSVRSIDAELPVFDLRSMETRVADSLVSRRAPALLAGLFAAAALVLAAVGTFGVLSYAVSQRRREIAIRMALGAQAVAIRRQFVWLGLRLLLGGTILGSLGAWLAGTAMKGLLYDVPPLHPSILGIAALVMLVATLSACLVPSHRAARVSPAEALSE